MNVKPIIRYPGGKQKFLECITQFLPDQIQGKFIDPFLGGGSIFFTVLPQKALLADINPDLIDLFEGVRQDPVAVWEVYQTFPSDREGYYRVRNMDVSGKDLAYRAARMLYLNRTCFKGMWRHNQKGDFNVGYG